MAAVEASAFAAVTPELRYDKKRKRLMLKPGDRSYLRPHHGYKLLGQGQKKLSPQRVGPFKILRRVGQLAYELDFEGVLNIHPVVLIIIDE